jgi:hypothetical protein
VLETASNEPYAKITTATIIAGANGRPLTKESFGNEFKAACKEAGVPGSAHGVRKIAATRAADAGATEAELMAIFGWTDSKMASHYTKTANRKRLAAQAMNKLATSIPDLGIRCGGKTNNVSKIKGEILQWWARQDSNLQPDGYEPPALTIELRAPLPAGGLSYTSLLRL